MITTTVLELKFYWWNPYLASTKSFLLSCNKKGRAMVLELWPMRTKSWWILLTEIIESKNKVLGGVREEAMDLEHKEEAEAEILIKESNVPTATRWTTLQRNAIQSMGILLGINKEQNRTKTLPTINLQAHNRCATLMSVLSLKNLLIMPQMKVLSTLPLVLNIYKGCWNFWMTKMSQNTLLATSKALTIMRQPTNINKVNFGFLIHEPLTI